jgi:hypothetical protein
VSALRPVIGLTEWVTLPDGTCHLGKVDTAADSSSIDETLLSHCGTVTLGPDKAVRCAFGRQIRATRLIQIRMQGQALNVLFTVTDRQRMRCKILIGRDLLKRGCFLIDPAMSAVEAGDCQNRLTES